MNQLELQLSSSNDTALELSLDPNQVQGSGSIYAPLMRIPLQYRLHRPRSQNDKHEINFTLLELGGFLALGDHIQVAPISTEPLLEQNDHSRARSTALMIPIDSRRIQMMENYRAGNDMSLEIQIWGLAVINGEPQRLFERLRANSQGIQFRIPVSEWIKNVLLKWRFNEIHLIEIEVSKVDSQSIPSETLKYFDSAQRQFLNGNARETLANLYSAFEALAKHKGMRNPDQSFFENLLSNLPAEKRKKYRNVFRYYSDLLHLGRHESKQPNSNSEISDADYTSTVELSAMDSQFALIVGQTILSYLSKLP